MQAEPAIPRVFILLPVSTCLCTLIFMYIALQDKVSCIENDSAQWGLLDAQVDTLTVKKANEASELARLSSELAAMNTLFAQVAGDLSSFDAEFIRRRLKSFSRAVEFCIARNQLGGDTAVFIQQLQQQAERIDTSIRELRAQQSTERSFEHVLAVVEAAASVTNRQVKWDRVKCEELVIQMVKGMLPTTEAENASVVKEMTSGVGVISQYNPRYEL